MIRTRYLGIRFGHKIALKIRLKERKDASKRLPKLMKRWIKEEKKLAEMKRKLSGLIMADGYKFCSYVAESLYDDVANQLALLKRLEEQIQEEMERR